MDFIERLEKEDYTAIIYTTKRHGVGYTIFNRFMECIKIGSGYTLKSIESGDIYKVIDTVITEELNITKDLKVTYLNEKIKGMRW